MLTASVSAVAFEIEAVFMWLTVHECAEKKGFFLAKNMVLCRNSLLGNVTKATVNIGVNRKWVNYPFKRRTLVGVNVMFCPTG